MKRIIFFLVALSFSQLGFSYPEMVRHGYVNCTSCHISPNGGGILNGYGQVQAEEVLSTWSREGEGSTLHGKVTLPERLSLGGQFRALQLFAENAVMRSGRFIVMQADIEAAVKAGPIQLVATAGWQDDPVDPLVSRRHYVLYHPSEESLWMFRAGSFLPAYGINTADHAISIKGGLGIGQSTETYNIEGAWLGENFDGFATAILGVPGKDREKGIALRSAYNLGDRTKLGVSYYLGIDSNSTRQLFGPFAIVGLTEHCFLLAELDFQHLSQGASTFGPASYLRLDYEWIKGIHTYLIGEWSKLNPAATASTAFGIGAQFFPRPHFEFRAEYNRRRDSFTRGTDSDYGWLMFHYYL